MPNSNSYVSPVISIVFLFIPMLADTHEISTSATAARMVRAADNLINSLTSEKKKALLFPFKDEERFDWQYIPRGRAGLALKDMTENQRRLAMNFLKAGLSRSGYLKASSIKDHGAGGCIA